MNLSEDNLIEFLQSVARIEQNLQTLNAAVLGNGKKALQERVESLERVVNFSASFVMLCLYLLPLLDRGRLISWNESPTRLMSVMLNGRLSRPI
jgi:hypothetical protein